MPINHHPLHSEFPDHFDAIHKLKENNAHFQRLMAQYEEIDKEIYRMEEGIETPEDAVLTEEKKKRLLLKDEIAKMISDAEA
ncbi:MAG: DUF465 domain-containing protein [Verrucomicrobiales bacterium]|nr:DUF465 domain-containing protein [Verrucomicrobiales bacterium]